MGRYREHFTVYKRGKYYYYRTYDSDGYRTTPKSTGKKTKAEAMAWCEEHYRNNSLVHPRLTIAEYAQSFFGPDGIYYKDRSTPLARATVKQIEHMLHYNILPTFGSWNVAEITQSDIKNYRIKLLDSGLTTATVRNVLKPLSFMLKQLYADGVIQRNPFDGLPGLDHSNEAKRDSFTEEEVIKLYKSVPEDVQALLLIMILTGCRQGEAYALNQDDVKKEGDLLYFHLYRQCDYSGNYAPLKTRDCRDCVIVPELVEVFGKSTFCRSKLYEQCNPVIRTFDNWEQRKLALHSIRHFFITDTKAKGINNQLVEVYCGHSLRGIENVYTHYKVKDFVPILEWQKKMMKKLK